MIGDLESGQEYQAILNEAAVFVAPEALKAIHSELRAAAKEIKDQPVGVYVDLIIRLRVAQLLGVVAAQQQRIRELKGLLDEAVELGGQCLRRAQAAEEDIEELERDVARLEDEQRWRERGGVDG